MKTLFTCLVTLLIQLPASGQYYYFEKITEQDGLSDNRVTSFLKDKTGFLWIGTANGLNRYDGHEFKIYKPGQKRYKISHEQINDIEQDQQGRLWISTWNGLNLLNVEKDSLVVFSPDEDPHRQKKNKLSSSLIWDTYADRAGRIWIAPDARDLCYYRPSTDEFTYLPWRDFVKKIMPSRGSLYTAIHKIIRKSDEEIWLGTTAGLFGYNIVTGEFRHYGGDDPHDCVSLYYDSSNHRVFFGQENLYVYNEGDQQAKKLSMVNRAPVNRPDRLPLVLGALSGLWIIHSETGTASRISVSDKDLFTLHHKDVNVAYRDRESLWVGTSEGVRLYNTHLNLFHFQVVFPDTLHMTAGNVYQILERDNGYYIASYNENKLIIMDERTGEQQHISSIAGKPLIKCSKIYEDTQQRLWVLSSHHIFVSDKSHKHFSLFPFPKDDGDYLFIDMIEDADGNYWFASMRDGIYYFNPKKKSWTLRKEKTGLFASRPTSLLSDPAHRSVWIGDYSFGAFHHDMDAQRFTYHGMDANNPDFLKSALITALTLDKEGHVWLATNSGGVSRYSYKDKTFKTFSTDTGLPESTINAVQADQNGNLWLASHQGLTCMQPDGNIIKHFSKNNGLPFASFNSPFTMNDRGELLIGIANGFLKFHPDSLSTNSPDFPVVISAVLQGEKLAQATTYPFNENEFTFRFSALTYSLPRLVTYFYKLEGYDKDWVNAGNNHTAKYTNLGNGHYTFQVKAIDHTGKASASIASVTFSIAPPFWKEWWFIGIVILSVTFILYTWINNLQQKVFSQKTLNQFATSLYNKTTIEEVFWDIARNCIHLLQFEDCVVYMQAQDRPVLVQKAAAGPKIGAHFQIQNPIEIPIGAGIVGSVAKTGKAEIIADTSKDPRYIVDDRARLSEIAVPIIVEGKVFGVIDSEHSQRKFYSRWHLQMLEEVATICSAKISRYFVEEQIRSKVARDLHDDMGSTLSSIKIMSNIALEKKETEAAQNYLRSIRQNAAQMQESMSDIVWAINPDNDTIEKVIIKMKEFAAEILEPLNIQYEFFEEGDLHLSRIDLNTRKDFYLIFKEAINNAAKYSECRKVTVHLCHTTEGIQLILKDDGKGFDHGMNNHSGNGLKNMKHRSVNIKADLKILSQPGAGTEIRLKLPSHDQGM
ncbi:MAG: two-component regulator propeller domain-containing protein [Bacteroidota bacterium]